MVALPRNADLPEERPPQAAGRWAAKTCRRHHGADAECVDANDERGCQLQDHLRSMACPRSAKLPEVLQPHAAASKVAQACHRHAAKGAATYWNVPGRSRTSRHPEQAPEGAVPGGGTVRRQEAQPGHAGPQASSVSGNIRMDVSSLLGSRTHRALVDGWSAGSGACAGGAPVCCNVR